jgi:WD40 repeat protein
MGHTAVVSSVVFSPDGKKLISGSFDHTLQLWDVANGRPVKFPIKGHTSTITSICVSPNSQKIVSASLDGAVRIDDAQTGHYIGSPWNNNIKDVVSIAFSPNGRQFVVASSYGLVCLFDAESHTRLASYRKDCINKLSSMLFLSDGKQLTTFSIDGTTETFDAFSGETIDTSQSSSRFLSDSSNSTLLAQNGEPLLQLFPIDNPNFGHWAYIDSILIRRGRNGLTTVTDMSGAERAWEASRGKRRAGMQGIA